MTKLKAILFDLDGTLRASLPEGFEVFVEYARRVGVTLSDDQALAIEREAHRYWASAAQVGSDLARYDTRAFWENYNRVLLRAVGAPECADCAQRIQELFDAHYDPQDVVYVDSYATLAQLKARGFTLGLVSNRDEELDTYTGRLNLRGFFDFTLSGGQAQCYKPEPAIFHRALELAGNVAPAEALYVGDNYFADIVGALSVGMDAVLVDPRRAFVGYHPKRIRHLRDVLGFIGPL